MATAKILPAMIHLVTCIIKTDSFSNQHIYQYQSLMKYLVNGTYKLLLQGAIHYV